MIFTTSKKVKKLLSTIGNLYKETFIKPKKSKELKNPIVLRACNDFILVDDTKPKKDMKKSVVVSKNVKLSKMDNLKGFKEKTIIKVTKKETAKKPKIYFKFKDTVIFENIILKEIDYKNQIESLKMDLNYKTQKKTPKINLKRFYNLLSCLV